MRSIPINRTETVRERIAGKARATALLGRIIDSLVIYGGRPIKGRHPDDRVKHTQMFDQFFASVLEDARNKKSTTWKDNARPTRCRTTASHPETSRRCRGPNTGVPRRSREGRAGRGWRFGSLDGRTQSKQRNPFASIQNSKPFPEKHCSSETVGSIKLMPC